MEDEYKRIAFAAPFLDDVFEDDGKPRSSTLGRVPIHADNIGTVSAHASATQ